MVRRNNKSHSHKYLCKRAIWKRKQFVALLETVEAVFTLLPQIKPMLVAGVNFFCFAAKPKGVHMDIMSCNKGCDVVNPYTVAMVYGIIFFSLVDCY